MCCQRIICFNRPTINFPRSSNLKKETMVRSQSTSKSTKMSAVGRRVRVSRHTLKRMVEETLLRLYGTTSNGSPLYRVGFRALESLRVAAEEYLTKMWNQVHDKAVIEKRRDTVELEDFVEWRREHIITPPKPKLIGGKTLCELFESIKKKRRGPRSNACRGLEKRRTPCVKEPLTMYVEQSYFDEMNEEIKTVEARPYYPSYHGYAEGDSILFITLGNVP